jgi:uncharacterized delta-60 repeat protein
MPAKEGRLAILRPSRMAKAAVLAALAAVLLATVAPPTARATTLAVQPDGKIVLAGIGYDSEGVLFRFLPDGERDPSFGDGGVVPDDRFVPFIALAVRDDGRILAGAAQPTYDAGGERFALGRYLSDGSPDPSFGRAGAVAAEPGFAPQAILPRADGSFVVGANAPEPTLAIEHGIARLYRPDGSLAGSLGAVPPVESEGVLRSAWLHDLIAGPGDALIGAGYVHARGSYLVRFAPDRAVSYDPSFGSGAGMVPLAWGSSVFDAAWHEGKVLLTGILGRRLFLARLAADGTADADFGEGGSLARDLPGASIVSGNALAIDRDGRFLVAGSRWPRGAFRLHRPCAPCREAFVARFEPDGTLDPTFGEGGVAAVTHPDGEPLFAMGAEVALTPDGRVLVGATAEHTERPTTVLARFTAEGRLDPTFGDRGVVLSEPCPGSEARGPRGRCVPSPRVELLLRRAPGGGLRIRGLVRPDYGWAPMHQVRLRLPRMLRFRPAFVRAVDECHRLCGFGGGSNSSALVHASSRGLSFNQLGRPRLSFVLAELALRIPPDLGGRRLAFRLQVRFGREEPWRSVVLRRALPD